MENVITGALKADSDPRIVVFQDTSYNCDVRSLNLGNY